MFTQSETIAGKRIYWDLRLDECPFYLILYSTTSHSRTFSYIDIVKCVFSIRLSYNNAVLSISYEKSHETKKKIIGGFCIPITILYNYYVCFSAAGTDEGEKNKAWRKIVIKYLHRVVPIYLVGSIKYTKFYLIQDLWQLTTHAWVLVKVVYEK